MYVCTGLCAVDVEPSPKFHAQAVGALEDVSVKVTISGAIPDVGIVVKLATGGVTAPADTTT
jgi:hypothetical protein